MGEGAQSSWIWESVDLLNQLEGNKIEDEGLLVEDDNHHILSKLDVHDELVSIESNLCSILLFVIVPNDHLVSLLLVDQHNHIGFVHHFDEGDILVELLHLLLESGTT